MRVRQQQQYEKNKKTNENIKKKFMLVYSQVRRLDLFEIHRL